MKLTKINKVWIKRLFFLGTAITLLIFALNFYLVGFGVYGDGIGYYTPLRSLVFDGNLQVADEYEFLSQSASRFGGGIRVTVPIPEYSQYTLGTGLLLSPFFALGHLAAITLRTLGVDVEANGLSWPYELFYCLGSIALGIAGLVLCYKAARRFFSRTASALAVAGVWFASPLTFYLCLEVSMSHAVSQFLVSLFLYLCLTTSWANRLSRQVLLGIVLGLAVLVRPQNALFAIVPLFISLLGTELSETVNSSEKLRPSESKHRQGLFKGRGFPVVADLRRTARTLNLRSLIESKQVVAIGVIGIFTFLVQIPQMLVYWWQYGGLLDIPYFQEGTAVGQSASFNWGQPQILNVLFSGFHGLFAWHPLLFLAYAGLALTAQKFPRLALILLIAFFLQVYLISSWWCWWQGTSFGGRMFCNSSFIFVFGLAALWDRFKGESWKRLGAIATIFFMVWNALLVLQYESAMIPPSAPVPMSRIVKNQVRAVPFFVKHVLDR